MCGESSTCQKRFRVLNINWLIRGTVLLVLWNHCNPNRCHARGMIGLKYCWQKWHSVSDLPNISAISYMAVQISELLGINAFQTPWRRDSWWYSSLISDKLFFDPPCIKFYKQKKIPQICSVCSIKCMCQVWGGLVGIDKDNRWVSGWAMPGYPWSRFISFHIYRWGQSCSFQRFNERKDLLFA